MMSLLIGHILNTCPAPSPHLQATDLGVFLILPVLMCTLRLLWGALTPDPSPEARVPLCLLWTVL